MKTLKTSFMKKNIILFLTILLFNQYLLGQVTTVILQPAENKSKDAVISSLEKSKNRGVYPDLPAMSWTVDGAPVDYRSLIEFDLSNIPNGAIINSAKLSLYSYNSSGLGSHSVRSGSNESVLSRITSPWEESNVTWNNQPTITTKNQVFLSTSTELIQDYLNIDVLNLIEDMIAYPNNSHGFLFKLINEQHYRSMLFAASGHSQADLHPRLEITYTDYTDNCLILQPAGNKGKDAMISSLEKSKNRGVYPDLPAMSWTVDGAPVDYRSLIEFDLSNIPNGAIINSAKLSLYSYNSSGLGSHSVRSGSNESVLSRITSPWEESNVTWNNQPTITTKNQVFLSTSTELIQDYLNIDVLNLIEDMIEKPNNNHGFLLKLSNEQYYRSLLFAASDHDNPNLHPKLEVCYSITTSASKEVALKIALFPNPANDVLNISITDFKFKDSQINIFNSQGRIVKILRNVNTSNSINLSDMASGIYYVKLRDDKNIFATRKLFIK